MELEPGPNFFGRNWPVPGPGDCLYMDVEVKRAIRARMRGVRAGLDLDRLQAALDRQLVADGPWLSNTSVAGYAAFGSEASVGVLGSRLALPRVEGSRLGFARCAASELVKGPFAGVLEPPADAAFLSVDELEVVLLPGLAFTEAGARLGYGGGFYDRTLASAPALRVGVAFQAQIQSVLPEEAHDLRVHGLVTEAGFRWVTA